MVRWTIDMVKHKFYELYGNKATLLSTVYKNTKTKLHVYCNIHQCDVYTTWDKLKLGQLGCKKCRYSKVSKTLQRTPEEYYDLCKEKGLDLPIEDYINNRTKIKHKCSKGYVYTQTPNHHLGGIGCPKCSSKYSYTSKEYYDLCKEKGYDLPLEGYINTATKIKHRCSKGHIYEQRPDMHIGIQMQGCPICKESKGEKYIRNYLDKNNIKYISQKKFHDLKDRTYLSYDFYLPKYNTLIEYQGIQHFESVSFNGKDSSDLDKQQLHDKLKKEYAKNNGYKLLELKYTLNTQELVDRYLKRRLR